VVGYLATVLSQSVYRMHQRKDLENRLICGEDMENDKVGRFLGHSIVNRVGAGPSRATAGPGDILTPLGRKFRNFLEWRILVYFIFLSDRGPCPKRRRARGNLPHLPLFLDRPE